MYWQGAKATEHEELSNFLMVEHGVDGGAVIMNLVIDNGFLTVKSRRQFQVWGIDKKRGVFCEEFYARTKGWY